MAAGGEWAFGPVVGEIGCASGDSAGGFDDGGGRALRRRVWLGDVSLRYPLLRLGSRLLRWPWEGPGVAPVFGWASWLV